MFIISCLVYIWYLKVFKKYTRERFAFTGLTLISSLISTIILQIYSSQGYVSTLINTSNFLFKTKFESYHTDLKDNIIAIILVLILYQYITKLYKNWDGPISEIDNNKKVLHESSFLLSDAIRQLKDFVSKEKLIIPFEKNSKIDTYNVFIQREDNKLPWNENVFELLTFANQQYKINLTRDYYSDEKCFFSKYGVKNENIAILCSIDYPKDSAISRFLTFTKKSKIEFSKYIIAIKNYDNDLHTITKNNTEIIIRNENEMLNCLIDFSTYKDFIKSQFIKNEITIGKKYTLKDTYVELIGRNEQNESIGEIGDYIKTWLNSSDENKHLAILGEYGCGKSVQSLKIAFDLFENQTNKSRIPIIIELRGKSPRNLNMIEILSTWATNFRIDAISLMKLHKSGKLLIIFEGFDEMDMIGDREMRLNHFQRLWEFALPNSKIIITGRPNFFLDDAELKTNLGIDKPFQTSHFCEAIYLEKFNIEQIKQALRNIDENTKNQVINILTESTNSNFYDLVSRPAILYLVAVIWKDRKLSEYKEKINSAVVISEFIKYSYSRQNNKNIHFPLTEKEREYFMIGIAVGMLEKTGFTNQINKNDLESIILKLYRSFPENFYANDNAIQPKRKQLKERMIDNKQAEDTILTDVRSCGILVNELTRKDYFKFAHKSFLEYQVSLFFVELILKVRDNNNILMNSISYSLEISTPNFIQSKETISFISDILISKLNLSIDEDKHKLCKRLFSILYPYKFLNKYPRLAALIEIYSTSKTVFFFVVGLNLALSLLCIFMLKIFGRNLFFSISSTLISLVSLLYISITFLNSNKKNGYKRALIWLQCCEQLNIDENVISKIVPVKFILFLRGKIVNDPISKLFKDKLDKSSSKIISH